MSAFARGFLTKSPLARTHAATLASIPARGIKMKIAVEGCCHGELDAIYNQIHRLEQVNRYKVDLLLICGDFQAVRNWRDLQCMAVPNKYKQLHDFHKYYTGEKTAPIPTVVIGGNHEASNYMWELYHGGWLAPNIYYLGTAGCINVNGLRIAGLSGIYKPHDFRLGFFERIPYDNSSMRSIYHVRESTIRKLSLLSTPQVIMSHDWPNTIEQHGDTEGLLQRKTFWREEVATETLGSPPLMGLLRTLKPNWWFSGHMHIRFEAAVVHEGAAKPPQEAAAAPNPDEIQMDDDEFDSVPGASGSAAPTMQSGAPGNPDEITLDDEADAVEAPPPPPPPRRETRFLALDKCVRNRQYLEVIDFEAPDSNPLASPTTSAKTPAALNFDPEWLAISRAFHPWFSTTKQQRAFPDETEARAMVARELEWVNKHVKKDEQGCIPVADHQIFTMTAPGPGTEGNAKFQQPPWYTNPQTEAFCRMLHVENKVNPPPADHKSPRSRSRSRSPPRLAVGA